LPAYINNLAKNGDNYWVFANVTPDLVEAGRISGYFSCRRPRREAIEVLTPLYRKMQDIEQTTPHDPSAASLSWLVDHHSCRLGQWYDGEGRETFGRFQGYRELETPHRIVHQSVHEAMEQINLDWERDPEVQGRIIERYQRMEQASVQVFNLLEKLEEQAKTAIERQA